MRQQEAEDYESGEDFTKELAAVPAQESDDEVLEKPTKVGRKIAGAEKNKPVSRKKSKKVCVFDEAANGY